MEKIERDIAVTSKAQQVLNIIWPLIRSQTARIALLFGGVVIGLIFNWSWFVAVGVAPIIVSILPCAVMCALGLCMRPSEKGSYSKNEE